MLIYLFFFSTEGTRPITCFIIFTRIKGDTESSNGYQKNHHTLEKKITRIIFLVNMSKKSDLAYSLIFAFVEKDKEAKL